MVLATAGRVVVEPAVVGRMAAQTGAEWRVAVESRIATPCPVCVTPPQQAVCPSSQAAIGEAEWASSVQQ